MVSATAAIRPIRRIEASYVTAIIEWRGFAKVQPKAGLLPFAPPFLHDEPQSGGIFGAR
jgi:hypothetical protein